MKSPVVKRSILVGRHKTSVSLEHSFWSSLKDIAKERGVTMSELISDINANRHQSNLSSAVRVFVLNYFRARAAGPAAASRE